MMDVIEILNKTNKKKMFSLLLIMTITVLAISMIGGVSAEDKTITNSTDGGLKTAIDGVASGDRITLNNGVYSGVNNRGLFIDKDLTIVGKSKDKVIIDAQKKDRIFTIESGSLTLINLKIINGNVSGSGGAIYDRGGSLYVYNSTFENNVASHGGAISSLYTLEVYNSVFANNQGGTGGAINGPCYIVNSTFNENLATNNGGAIGVGLSLDHIYSINCSFNNNRAYGSGGAIYTISYGIVNKSTFDNNYAGGSNGGGAIYIKGAGFDVFNSNFNNNCARYPTAFGGAIHISADRYKELRVSNSKFNKNSIGSGIYEAISNYIYNAEGCKVSIDNVVITPDDGSKIIIEEPNPPTQTEKPNSPTSTLKKSDLKITKISKKGNYRYVYIKNVGKATAGKSYLGVYVGKKKIKTIKVTSIKAGKYLKIKVTIAKKYKTKQKIFKVDIKNTVKESNEKNNSLKAK